MQTQQTTSLCRAANDYVTIVAQACAKVNGFELLYKELERAINVTGKSKSTLLITPGSLLILHCIISNYPQSSTMNRCSTICTL